MSDTPKPSGKPMSNAATRRSHAIVELLAGRFFDGMSNKDLAQALHTSPVNISRNLSTLEQIGYVQKLENGRWVLSVRPLSIMQNYFNHCRQLQSRMADTTRSIISGSTNTAG